MKRIAGIALTGLTVLGLSACSLGGGSPSGNKAESRAQAADTRNLVYNEPVPIYTHSQIRQELIDIENAQANGVQSTTFFMPNWGPPQGSCPSIGAPVPTTDQLTNPVQPIYDDSNSGASIATIGQMDPNGVYSGNSTGTYVMCVNPANGQIYAQYWEGNVRVVFGPAVWDPATNSPKLIGTPSNEFNNIKTAK